MAFINSETIIRLLAVDPKKRNHSKYPDKLNSKRVAIISTIIERFNKNHSINLLAHIDQITKVGYTVDEGFEFKPVNRSEYRNALMATGRFVDDSESIIGKICALATHGTGYREMGYSMDDKGLHCAIASDICSVHLDATQFSIMAHDGSSYYSLDALQHVINDLLFRDLLFVKNAYKLSYFFGAFVGRWSGFLVGRLRPVIPNTSDGLTNYGFDINAFNHKYFRIDLQVRRDFSYNSLVAKETYSVKGFLNGLRDIDGGNTKVMIGLKLEHEWFK